MPKCALDSNVWHRGHTWVWHLHLHGLVLVVESTVNFEKQLWKKVNVVRVILPSQLE